MTLRLHHRTLRILRASSHSIARSRQLTTLGIRREDPKRIWERRVPLTPSAVSQLLQERVGNINIQVESCTRRCYGDEEYQQTGAEIVPKLTGEVDLILGIKEPPITDVLEENMDGILAYA
jgi:alpha-aminoadipic semialdehyde synthase